MLLLVFSLGLIYSVYPGESKSSDYYVDLLLFSYADKMNYCWYYDYIVLVEEQGEFNTVLFIFFPFKVNLFADN